MNIEDLTETIYEKEENGICTLIFNTPKRRNDFRAATKSLITKKEPNSKGK